MSRKVISDWWKAKSSTQEHKELHRRIENKVTALNQIGWDKIKEYQANKR